MNKFKAGDKIRTKPNYGLGLAPLLVEWAGMHEDIPYVLVRYESGLAIQEERAFDLYVEENGQDRTNRGVEIDS